MATQVIQQAERTLFDFAQPIDATHWSPTDDVVMGGRSYSRMGPASDGTARFAGVVSLENNGGFASVRSASGHHDLRGYDGVALRLRGDGKVYGFFVRSGRRFRRGIRYQAEFRMVPAGEWLAVAIPFAALQPMVFGMTLPIAPPLDRSDITSFGLIIADKQAGPFELEIDWIKAYRD